MRIIGVDPGTRHLGWGVVNCEGTRLKCVGCGVVHMAQTMVLAERLVRIDQELGKLIGQYCPDEGAVEAIFFAKDAQAASKLGHARGVALLALARAGLPIGEYEPTRVKRAVVGRGRADKVQVGLMVKAILGMGDVVELDASDALAVAITHAQYSHVDRVMRRSGVLR